MTSIAGNEIFWDCQAKILALAPRGKDTSFMGKRFLIGGIMKEAI